MDLPEYTDPIPHVADHPIFSGAQPVSMISGDAPKWIQKLPLNQQEQVQKYGHQLLGQDLKRMGLRHEATRGRYGSPEKSYIVYGGTKNQMLSLANKFGQDSFLHMSNGHKTAKIHYSDLAQDEQGQSLKGMHRPTTGTYAFHSSNQPDDYYTHLPGKGYLRLNFDFDKPPQQDAAVVKSEAFCILGSINLNTATRKSQYMNSKELNASLAKAIKSGIEQFQTAIQKNRAKEQSGMDKLQKALGGDDPALTGAGGNLSAGSATVGVPNLMRGEVKGGGISVADFARLANDRVWGACGHPWDGRQDARDEIRTIVGSQSRAGYKNKRAESEASKVEKGALPEGEGAGVPGGVSDMSNNLDAGFGKGEMDEGQGCQMCGGQKQLLGVLGRTVHLVCRGCGVYTSTPMGENTEAKEGAEPNVEKAELEKVGLVDPLVNPLVDPMMSINPVHAIVHHANVLTQHLNNLPPEQMQHGAMVFLGALGATGLAALTHAAIQKLKQPKTEARSQEWYANRKIPGPSQRNRPEDPQVEKGEIKKEEISPSKEVPMTATVTAEKVPTAKDGSEKIPAAKNHDGSGEVTKGKELGKGAMVDHIKAQAKKANVPVKDVLGSRPPKTLETSLPPPSPKFQKAAIPGGVQREVGIKGGYDKKLPVSPLRTAAEASVSREHPRPGKGGVQSQIAAVKKPLIPMVNQGGPVAKAMLHPGKPGENAVKEYANGPRKGGTWGWVVASKKAAKARSNNKVAESKAQEVEKGEIKAGEGLADVGYYGAKNAAEKKAAESREKTLAPKKMGTGLVPPVTKAEPTMAKPVTQSPSSAPAGKVSAPKPKAAAPKISSL
jgi:hypothetical protein